METMKLCVPNIRTASNLRNVISIWPSDLRNVISIWPSDLEMNRAVPSPSNPLWWFGQDNIVYKIIYTQKGRGLLCLPAWSKWSHRPQQATDTICFKRHTKHKLHRPRPQTRVACRRGWKPHTWWVVNGTDARWSAHQKEEAKRENQIQRQQMERENERES